MSGSSFDYVIVGGGSAGCVLASRLTEQGDVSVLLLEAGPRDHDPMIHIPGAAGFLLRSGRNNWNYTTVPQTHLNDRQIAYPAGRVLGGSSSINGMVYIRGNKRDFDQWAALGAEGWSYDDVLPYFKRAEGHEDRDDEFHGTSGPLRVKCGRTRNPLFEAFIEAGRQAGYRTTSDFNGSQQEGFGRLDLTIAGGRRCSTARAYLRTARRRNNLRIVTGAIADRVIFENHRAVGVRYRRGSQSYEARARQEVVVASGAIGSPGLLLRSGIGPADELKRAQIPVVADSPEVGKNLQDHLEVPIGYSCIEPVSIGGYSDFVSQARFALQWLVSRTGPATTSHFEAAAFIKTDARLGQPNLQLHFFPLCVSCNEDWRAAGQSYQCFANILKPRSRGWVGIRPAGNDTAIVIDPQYLSEAADRDELHAAIAMTREVLQQRAFERFRGSEQVPGAHVTDRQAVDAFIRARAVSGYHPCGTCRMGDEAAAVVDPQCRVNGVVGLRVVDASVMPEITGGNTNAATIMIAEKASDLILGRSFGPTSPQRLR